jgi:hypothetical protein
MKKEINDYETCGFTVLNYLNQIQFDELRKFTLKLINNLYLTENIKIFQNNSVENYHKNLLITEEIHRKILNAKNRHLIPPDHIKEILLNSNIKNFLKKIHIHKFKLWDEGLGWLAFRLIRPGFEDGYPLSKKDWGPGHGTVSIWIPIIGFNNNQIIGFISGSHQKEYEKFLPVGSKFTKDEYRLKETISPNSLIRPNVKAGNAILFSPKTIHTEDIYDGDLTRLSLEFRIKNE